MEAAEILALLTPAPSCRVAVVGDVMIDVYTWGRVDRISPEAPVPVVDVSHDTRSPGGAANAAVCVAALGAHSTLFGTVGADLQADQLVHMLSDQSVVARCAQSVDEPTITKHRIWSGGQQLLRLDHEKRPAPGVATERLRNMLVVDEFDAILVSDYGKGVVDRESAQWVIGEARRAGVPVVVDPKSEDFSLYAGCTVIKPNEKEARKAYRFRHGVEGTIEQIGEYLLSEVSECAVITRGADGIELFVSGEHRHIPVHRQNVYDVTGAGDVVAAVLTIGVGLRWSIHEACRLANAAARVSVSRVGTGGVSVDDVIREVEHDE